jgi:hypothetical protein
MTAVAFGAIKTNLLGALDTIELLASHCEATLTKPFRVSELAAAPNRASNEIALLALGRNIGTAT